MFDKFVSTIEVITRDVVGGCQCTLKWKEGSWPVLRHLPQHQYGRTEDNLEILVAPKDN